MPTEEIAPDVHWIRLGRVNSYLVELDGGAVLVDTGLPLHRHALAGVLAERGLLLEGADPGRRLRAILLTHRHLDHAGGAAAIAERTGAEVFAHRADHEAVAGRERLSPMRPGRFSSRLLEPLVALSDQRVFRYRPWPAVTPIDDGWAGVGDGLAALHLPGHTPGHAGYLHEHRQGRVAICGDGAVSRGDGALIAPSPRFTVDPRAARRSLERLAALAADLYCFGHGPPVAGAVAVPALRDLALRPWR